MSGKCAVQHQQRQLPINRLTLLTSAKLERWVKWMERQPLNGVGGDRTFTKLCVAITHCCLRQESQRRRRINFKSWTFLFKLFWTFQFLIWQIKVLKFFSSFLFVQVLLEPVCIVWIKVCWIELFHFYFSWI